MDTMTAKQTNDVGMVNFDKMKLTLKTDAQKEAARKFNEALLGWLNLLPSWRKT